MLFVFFDLCLENFLGDEEAWVFSYHSGANGTAEGVLYLHAIDFTTKKDTDRWILIGALDIAII